MTKPSVAVAMGCIAAATMGSGPGLPAPQYTGHAEISPETGFDERYLEGRNVSPQRVARDGPFVNGRSRGLRYLGGNAWAYSAAPSLAGGPRYLGGNVWAYSSPVSHGVLSYPRGTAFGYASQSSVPRSAALRPPEPKCRQQPLRPHSLQRYAAVLEVQRRPGCDVAEPKLKALL